MFQKYNFTETVAYSRLQDVGSLPFMEHVTASRLTPSEFSVKMEVIGKEDGEECIRSGQINPKSNKLTGIGSMLYTGEDYEGWLKEG